MSQIDIFRNILEFIFCLIDIYLLYMFGATLYKEKYSAKANMIHVFAFSMLLFSTSYVEDYSTIAVLFQFLLLVVFVQLLFKGTIISKFVLSLLYYIVLGIVTVIVTSIIGIVMGEAIGTYSDHYILRIITSIIIKAVMVSLLLLMNKRYKGIETHQISTKHFMVYLLVVLFVLILTFEVLFLNNESISNTLVIVIFTVFVLIFVISLILLFRYYSNREKIATMELMIKEATIRRDFDIQSLKPQVEVMKLKHDLKNHFLTLRSLLEQEDHQSARDYIDHLVSHPAMKSYVHTNNEIINAILNTKISEHLDIVFTVRHDDGNYAFQSEVLTIIFGNALDNAIEAIEKVVDLKKEITIILSENNQYCKIFIANPMAEKPIEQDQHLLSSKRENSVGFGMMNMQEAVNKQGGRLEYRILENDFELIVLLEK